MKKTIFLIALLFTINISFSQGYMDEITNKACECIETVSDTLETQRRQMELGFCIINAAVPYKKKIKKDYNIDFKNIDTQGEELGRIIGLRMISICPDALMKLVDEANPNEEVDYDNSTNIVEGHIIKITDNKFVEFSIKEESGKISKYYWFTFIESTTEMSSEYKKLADKNVQIIYTSQEFFDARIGEYRTFNIIKEIEIIDY